MDSSRLERWPLLAPVRRPAHPLALVCRPVPTSAFPLAWAAGAWGRPGTKLGHGRNAALWAHFRLRPPESEPPSLWQFITAATKDLRRGPAGIRSRLCLSHARLEQQPVLTPGAGCPWTGRAGRGQGTVPGGLAGLGRAVAMAGGCRKPLCCPPGPRWAGAAPSQPGTRRAQTRACGARESTLVCPRHDKLCDCSCPGAAPGPVPGALCRLVRGGWGALAPCCPVPDGRPSGRGRAWLATPGGRGGGGCSLSSQAPGTESAPVSV